MAFSKAFLLFGLLFTLTLFISSQVSARHLLTDSATTQPQSVEKTDGYYGGGYGHGYHGGHYHHGGHGGHYPPQEEEKDQEKVDPQYYGHGGYGGGGYGHGGYGGGGYGHGGYGHGGYGHGGYGHGGYGGHYPPKDAKATTTTTEEKGN